MQSPQLRGSGPPAGRGGGAAAARVAEHVPAAGKAWTSVQQSPIVPSPRTPDLGPLLDKHRRRTQPGEMTVHWGLKNLPLPDPNGGYGLKPTASETVGQNFKSGQKFGVAEYRDTVGEAVYRSTTREPLGRGWVRGHPLPTCTNASDFQGFGLPTDKSRPVKEVISPRDAAPDSEEARALYRKSHGSVEGGEVLTRNYEWPSTVTAPTFRFGAEAVKDSSHQGHGVKAALSMDAGGEPHSVPNTVLGVGAVPHFREATGNQLGTPRNLCAKSGRALADDHAFGLASGTDKATCGELIRGTYPVAEQLPDRDLGRCLAEGRRNFMSREPFGVPSVRTDRVAPPVEKRSVANFTNWGDCTGAAGVLSPGRHGHSGIGVSDFEARRTLGELQDIFKGAGLSAIPSEVFKAASAESGDSGSRPTASVEAVMSVYADWSASSAATLVTT